VLLSSVSLLYAKLYPNMRARAAQASPLVVP
jgi:hypothetical protein